MSQNESIIRNGAIVGALSLIVIACLIWLT